MTDRYRTPWGPAVNLDGPASDDVRDYFLANAVGWLRDFHVDGLRLDAVHEFIDRSARPFLAELAGAVDELSERSGRPHWLIAESADNDPRVVTPGAAGGLGLDAQWNDDFHHAVHAVLTGERDGYFADFGRVDDVARAMGQGFVYQGQYSALPTPPSRRTLDRCGPRAVRDLRPEPRPGGQPARRRPVGDPRAGPGACGSRRRCSCSRPASPCSSWARSTARPLPSRTSWTTATPS